MESNVADRPCETCRQRRVKCDKRLPACFRCENTNRTCSGYARKFLDESTRVRERYHTGSIASSNRKRKRAPSVRNHPANRESVEENQAAALLHPTRSNNTNAAGFTELALLNRHPITSSPAFPDALFSGEITRHERAGELREGDIHSASHPSARLIDDGTVVSPVPTTNHGTASTATSDDNFFDLDIDTYYANGNNACGFIPGAPVIISEDNPGFDEPTPSHFGHSSRGGTTDLEEETRVPLSNSMKEIGLLVKHFVEVIAPSMDLFDADAYFGQHLPHKVNENPMLRAAVAAVAAKHFGQVLDNKSSANLEVQNSFSAAPWLDGLGGGDWYYKAANYYDSGISHLRLQLQSCSQANSPASNITISSPVAISTASKGMELVDPMMGGGGPQTMHQTGSSEQKAGSAEDMLSAIAVFSHYESLNGYNGEWKQHIAGFQSLLKNSILPSNSLTATSSLENLSSLPGGRAAFWYIARADFFAAYEQHSMTQLDPEDTMLWEAAGLTIPAQIGTPANIPNPNSIQYSTHDRADAPCRHLIWLMAKAMNLFALHHAQDLTDVGSLDAWNDIRGRLRQWRENIPIHYKPYISIPIYSASVPPNAEYTSSPAAADHALHYEPKHSKLLFTAPMFAAALQLYHFTQLLLLMNRPLHNAEASEHSLQGSSMLRMFRRVARESEMHSRQICSIALGLDDHSARYLAVKEHMAQPLYIAGGCFEQEEDRSIVIRLLREVQHETGRTTAKQIEGLLADWGHEDRE